jgi:hypothetical protein
MAVVCMGALLFLGMGCYETEYPLGSADNAAVNPAYVGDYVVTDGDKTSTLLIRNIDNHLYYVEWIESGDKKPLRMVGYTADVNGVAFANLREFTDDGSIETKYLVMRIALSSDHATLTIRNLKDDFFKGKNVGSSEALQKVIGANIDDEAMYDGAAATATRVTSPSTAPAGTQLPGM